MGLFLENSTVEILYGSLLTFWIIYLYFVKDYGYWEVRDVPHVPAVFPLGSMNKAVLGRYLISAFDKIYKEFKDERYVGFIDVRRPCLFIKDPVLIKIILQKDFSHFTDRSWFNINPKDYMFNNLFNMMGQEWKDMRLKLTPAYTGAKMKLMFFLVKKCSDLLREVLEKMTEKNNVIDVKDVLSRFTVDIIATCAFGLEINSLLNEDSEFYQLGKKAMDVDFITLIKLYIYTAFPIFSKVYLFDFLDPKIKDFFTSVICSTIEYREHFNINRYDFLDLLIKLRQNQSILEEGEKPIELNEITRPEKREGLTIEEITTETFLFFTAGYETTSNTILFCLYELACNFQIQDKLFWEVEEVMERYKGEISYQALQEMTYMDQVINESMRRYPVFPQLMRNCTESYRIPGSTLVVEKDIKIIIPVYSLHHDPKYFPDPYCFNPERFSAKNCRERHPCVFLPFGEGPRMCIGFRFGLMKVKTALTTLLSDYEISLTPDTEVPLQMKTNAWTTLPSKPLMLVFARRHPKKND